MVFVQGTISCTPEKGSKPRLFKVSQNLINRLEWLKANEVPFDSFIMVDKYSRPVVDKNIAISLERFSEMEFVLAVEDSVDMVHFISRKMNNHVILFDRPWNRNVSNCALILQFRQPQLI